MDLAIATLVENSTGSLSLVVYALVLLTSVDFSHIPSHSSVTESSVEAILNSVSDE